jgi:DNA-binding response OmpR family regulator
MNRSDFAVAVVEDEHFLRSEIAHLVASAGFSVHEAACADDLDDIAARVTLALLIIDIGLPGEDGLALCRRYTGSMPELFTIILTARTAQVERVAAYRSGAGLFLSKPFDGDEFLAIIEGRFRLADRQRPEIRMGLQLRDLRLEGPLGSIVLSPNEARLLGAFAVAPDRTLEAYRIGEVLSLRESGDMTKGAIELAISRLRAKLRRAISEPQPIRSIYRFGYRLIPPVEVG